MDRFSHVCEFKPYGQMKEMRLLSFWSLRKWFHCSMLVLKSTYLNNKETDNSIQMYLFCAFRSFALLKNSFI